MSVSKFHPLSIAKVQKTMAYIETLPNYPAEYTEDKKLILCFGFLGGVGCGSSMAVATVG